MADPNVAYQAVLVANISIVAVVLVTGVFVLLKHQILGFDDVHWHAGEPDMVEGDSADAQSA